MDTTKEYIEMCGKAEEIQAQWNDVNGNYYFWSVDSLVHISYTDPREEYFVFHPEQWDRLNGRYIIWIPRQDQLQEIVPDLLWSEYDRMCVKLALEYQVRIRADNPNIDLHVSKEQAGLMVVMMQEYGKRWTGSEWVAE